MASGEYVRKGQELATVVDCSSASVTAAVSTRTYNDLRLGDAVRFRVAGSSREYGGRIVKLGLTSTGSIFAIPPEERNHQIAVSLPDLTASSEDRCAIGRTGELVFQGNGLTARIAELLKRYVGLS